MLSAYDKKLLNFLQTDLPISHRPFADLAEKMDSDESTVLHRLQELKRDGYLRRIGPFYSSDKLGYTGTLIALRVKPEHMGSVAEAINRYPGATHNYEREGRYNLWFTLITPDAELHDKILAEVSSLPGVEDMMDLVSRKKYKINVQFKLR
jgi:DNA-binding Lrp family transcriptional regulator